MLFPLQRSSSASEDQLDTVYANIQTFPSSRPRNTDHKHYVNMVHEHAQANAEDTIQYIFKINSLCMFSLQVPSSDEAELIYTTVAIKPRNHSRAPQESR